MAFIVPDTNISTKVSFYMRKDFRDDVPFDNYYISHYIDKGDQLSLIYYINKYMNTKKFDKRPDTPAYLIMPQIPKSHIPPY